MGHSRPLFSIYFRLFNTIQLTVNNKCSIKICRCLDSNRGPLESEATALPTEPQPQFNCLNGFNGFNVRPRHYLIPFYFTVLYTAIYCPIAKSYIVVGDFNSYNVLPGRIYSIDISFKYIPYSSWTHWQKDWLLLNLSRCYGN